MKFIIFYIGLAAAMPAIIERQLGGGAKCAHDHLGKSPECKAGGGAVAGAGKGAGAAGAASAKGLGGGKDSVVGGGKGAKAGAGGGGLAGLLGKLGGGDSS